MPMWLVWLAPVPLATCAAIAWTAWSSRTRGPVEPRESVQAYERFRAAMEAPVPAARTPRGEQEPPAVPGRPSARRAARRTRV